MVAPRQRGVMTLVGTMLGRGRLRGYRSSHRTRAWGGESRGQSRTSVHRLQPFAIDPMPSRTSPVVRPSYCAVVWFAPFAAMLLWLAPLAAQGPPGGFAETYALAEDRAAVLAQLVPGTEDYYFYRCLHSQQVGALDQVPPLLAAWIEKHGRTERAIAIETRQALLHAGRDPERAYTLLRDRLGVRFDQQQQVPGARPDLPSRLDPALVSQQAFVARALAQHPGSLQGFSDEGLAVVAGSLPDPLLTDLMQRDIGADLPGLPALIARYLGLRNSSFAALRVGQRLTLAQLDELVQLVPSLLGDPEFVSSYLGALAPAGDVSLARSAAARARWLDELWGFARRLGPAQNALKSQILHERLLVDLATGAPDKPRFLAYLQLPRSGPRTNPEFLRRTRREEVFDRASGVDGLPTVGDDDAMVRTCFEQLFEHEDSFAEYQPFVREEWLRQLFAETKLLLGKGDMERWYSMLADPSRYEQLTARVELAFTPTQPRQYAAAAPVAIELDVKNVPKLLVKVFRLDAYEYLKATDREVDPSIDLDGVVASDEQVFEYSEPPLQRVRRRFEFPALAGAGTWVIEFVGNGVSSRAVIQKGSLTVLPRMSAAGHVLRVVDDTGAMVADAQVFCAGREFSADAAGEIVVPFAPASTQRRIIVHRGPVATQQSFWHAAEDYSLQAGVFVDREALRSGRPATLLVRPRLSVGGVSIALDLLEDAAIELVATTRDGVVDTQVVRGPKWTEGDEYEHPFAVPRDLAQLAVTVRGRVDNRSQGRKDEVVAAPVVFAVGAIDATATIATPLVGKSAEGWFVEVRGRSGEPIVGCAVSASMHHRFCTDVFDLTLATDADGRVHLGPLPGIDTLSLGTLPGAYATIALRQPWTQPTRADGHRLLLTGRVGQTLRVPYAGAARQIDRTTATLFELRGTRSVRDASAQLAIADGFVELRELPPGAYLLTLAEDGRAYSVDVVEATVAGDWAIARERALPLLGRAPLHVVDLAATPDQVSFRVANAGADARVHVFATRYAPAFAPLARFGVPAMSAVLPTELGVAQSDYVAGRVLSDELRYVLERRYQKRYPGNMLARPSLLLNPWAPTDESNAGVGLGGGAGGRYGGRGARPGGPSTGGSDSRADAGGPVSSPSAYADLDFLDGDDPLVANVRPDASGRVVLKRADLGPGQQIHVVAIDGDDLVHRTIELPLQPVPPRDLTLRRALDAGQHLTQQQRIEFVPGGGEARVDDVGAAQVQTFATLADVHRLLQTMTPGGDLEAFAFALRWPDLTDDEKREAYRQHACHELHFFLYHKDRAFFDAVLRPYLANKAHKQFLDQWLLGEDLQSWVEPWAFARLNLVERILLLQRLGRGEAVQRYVRELGELLPVDLARQQFGILSALRSGELVGRTVATERALEERQEAGKAKELASAAEAPAASPAPQAPGAPAMRKVRDELQDDEVAADKKAEANEAEKLADSRRRSETRAFYRAPEPTLRYVEHDYWHGAGGAARVPGGAIVPDPERIRANAFWRDYAAASPDVPFVSPHFIEASGNFTEAMFALAVLDLPFAAEPPVQDRTGDALALRPKTGLLLARSELVPAAAVVGVDPVLIRQDCFRLDDRYVFDGGQRRQKSVAGEFLAGTAYGSQVVLTNPTEVQRRLTVLLQIPAGSLPLQNGVRVRSVPVELGAFATTTLEFAFYWPRAGDFGQYPAQVVADGAFVGAAEAASRHVVLEPTTVDTASWEHVSQLGGDAEVLAYLGTQNLACVDLSRVAWRLGQRPFYEAVLKLLRSRLHYDATVWSFALLHRDVPTVREYLQHQEGLIATCGEALDSPLLTFDREQRADYQHAEFEPLFLARAHRVGPWRAIENPDVAAQWRRFVELLCYRAPLRAIDWQAITYCMILQGRVDEAMATFARVEAGRLTTRLQYDYMAAYLAMYRADVAEARRIATAHRDEPVARWRTLFREVVQQLDAASGAAVAIGNPDDRTGQQTQLAASEPQLDVAVEGGQIVLRHRNLASCEVRYHPLDIEFAFSNSPFAQQGLAAIAWVEPRRADVVTLPADAQPMVVPLPAEFQRGNVVVEVRGGGLVRRAQSLASAMVLQTSDNYGQLEVRSKSGGAPLAQVYVKVYARTGTGAVRFHKDGYTDLRGRFDYASVSTQGGNDAERFALLVLSDTDGAILREVSAPGR